MVCEGNTSETVSDMQLEGRPQVHAAHCAEICNITLQKQ